MSARYVVTVEYQERDGGETRTVRRHWNYPSEKRAREGVAELRKAWGDDADIWWERVG